MRTIFSTDTYQLKALHKTALLRGLLVLLGLVLGLGSFIEVAARLFFIPISFPSLGSDNFYFDYKIYALESQVRRNGQLDCLVLGSSVANSDLDPAVIETAYQNETGQKIHCFNIGIPALTAENAVPIAEAIVRRYQPDVVLFILIPRDLMDHEYTVKQLERNPWVNYHRGNITPENWLLVNTYTLRYLNTWQYWQTLANRDKMGYETEPITAGGYSRIAGLNQPYPRNWLLENDENLQNVWVSGKTYTDLDRLTALENLGTKFIFIEAPAFSIINLDRQDPSIQHYEQDYMANLEAYLGAKNIPLWRTLEIGKQIPEAGWFDWLHLNTVGSPILSQWVAEKLAENPELFK
ncbi:MAG: hypothetical protein CVU44_03420 [Chloroflexi bacterium HGW-Chloroflexi-6]|nr:MAG: hypothetical protein CVU44_03420 [Chloroflexi bacterium HGW-Chloroflexi-6]